MAAILSSAPSALPRAPHPHPDPILAAFARHGEDGERADDPFLDGGDEAAHVRRAAFEIEHHVADPLSGAVIGELAAAARDMDRKARLDQLLRSRRCAGRVEGRVFEQPNEFRFVSARDRRRPLRHDPERAVIADQAVAHAPFDRRRAGGWKKTDGQIVARVNYPVTKPW